MQYLCGIGWNYNELLEWGSFGIISEWWKLAFVIYFFAFFYFDFQIGWNLISTGILQLISWGHKHTHIRLLPGCDYMHESNQKTFVLKCSKIPYIALRFDNIPKKKRKSISCKINVFFIFLSVCFLWCLLHPTSLQSLVEISHCSVC